MIWAPVYIRVGSSYKDFLIKVLGYEEIPVEYDFSQEYKITVFVIYFDYENDKWREDIWGHFEDAYLAYNFASHLAAPGHTIKFYAGKGDNNDYIFLSEDGGPVELFVHHYQSSWNTNNNEDNLLEVEAEISLIQEIKMVDVLNSIRKQG